MKTFSILGTGWLGLELAKILKDTYNVKVSTRHKSQLEEYKDMGLNPYLLDEENLASLDFLLETDYLFINFPPRKSKNYLNFLENIYAHKKIANIKKIIFISSTSIYANENTVFSEDSTEFNTNSLVFKAEELIKNKTDVIFRCSGLMAENRIAGKYFSNKQTNNAEKKVNYIHRKDIIEATNFVIKNDINGTFNLCSAFHPTRKEIYLYNAKKYDFIPPTFSNENENINRVIDGSKIESLGFKYKYSNPFDFD